MNVCRKNVSPCHTRERLQLLMVKKAEDAKKGMEKIFKTFLSVIWAKSLGLESCQGTTTESFHHTEERLYMYVCLCCGYYICGRDRCAERTIDGVKVRPPPIDHCPPASCQSWKVQTERKHDEEPKCRSVCVTWAPVFDTFLSYCPRLLSFYDERRGELTLGGGAGSFRCILTPASPPAEERTRNRSCWITLIQTCQVKPSQARAPKRLKLPPENASPSGSPACIQTYKHYALIVI